MGPNTAETRGPQRARRARVLAVGVDEALVAGALATDQWVFAYGQATDAAQAVRKAQASRPDLIVVGGSAEDVARTLEALTADPATSGASFVAWRADAPGSEVVELTALGAVVALASPESLRRACGDALAKREAQCADTDAHAEGGARGRKDPPGEADTEALPLAGRRVIVADDDPAIAWFFADVLRIAGCEVDETGDGAAALDAARRRVPDAVFSDVRMPRLNGVRLCKALRADPVLSDVPVVLLSWREDWLPEACREAGATGSLIKHATPEQVLASVRAAMAPHVALGQRIESVGAARGSLAGISPYRVLRSTCVARRNARVTFRDRAHTWEIRVRDGEPHAAMRIAHSDAGDVARGEEALGSSLSLRGGRFAVTPEGSPVERELRGSFYEQVAEHVAVARGYPSARPLELQPTIPMSVGGGEATEPPAAASFELPRASATLVELPVRTVPMARRPLPAHFESTLRLVFPTLRMQRRPVEMRNAPTKKTSARRVSPKNTRAASPPASRRTDGAASRKPTTRWAVLGTALLVALALGQSGEAPSASTNAASRVQHASVESARRATEAGVDGAGATASPPPAAVRASRTTSARPR
jgi:two-component system phosphate regulon response regulator PhoB